MQSVNAPICKPQTITPAKPTAGSRNIIIGIVGGIEPIVAAEFGSSPSRNALLRSPMPQHGAGHTLSFEQFATNVPNAINASLKTRPANVVPNAF